MFKKYSPEQTAQRWKELAELTKFKTALNEGGCLLDTVKAANGTTYAIIKENANYFIKKSDDLKEAYTINDFKYLGSLERTLEKHNAYSLAKRRLDGIVNQIQEDLKYSKILKEMKDDEELLKQYDEVDSETPEEAPAAPQETPTAPQEAPAEVPATPEEAPVESPADEEDMSDEMPDEEDENMGDEIPDEEGESMSDEMPDEEGEVGSPEKIQSLLGKLQNEINRLPELNDALTKNILNTIITATKDGITDLDPEDKEDLAKRIEKDGKKIEENKVQKIKNLIQEKLRKKQENSMQEDPLDLVKEIVSESINKSKKKI
jgi:hypothetical protein